MFILRYSQSRPLFLSLSFFQTPSEILGNVGNFYHRDCNVAIFMSLDSYYKHLWLGRTPVLLGLSVACIMSGKAKMHKIMIKQNKTKRVTSLSLAEKRPRVATCNYLESGFEPNESEL